MKYPELSAHLATLGWSLARLARELGTPETRVRNWNRDTHAVPADVAAWIERHAARYAAWRAQVWRDDPPPGAK